MIRFTGITILTFAVLLAGGCNSNYRFVSSGSFGFDIGEPPSSGSDTPTITTTGDTDPGDNPATDPTPPPICDPLGTGDPVSSTSGLVATLTYMDPVTNYAFNASDFVPGMPNITQVLNNVFLSRLNKETSYFDQGFTDAQGNLLKDRNGNALIEYFALFIATQIQLGIADPEGEYQFAILADDGAVMNLSPDGGTTWDQKWIDNDGTHASALVCNLSTIAFHTGDKLPVEIAWDQGPKYQIALMLFWRTGTALSVDEPECGAEVGNQGFFTNGPSEPPAATQRYTDFLNRGWKVLTADNFLLPDSIGTNPCN
ncbi:MAG: hypothetical protein V1798_00260 [Pseudomonadota bacterium]